MASTAATVAANVAMSAMSGGGGDSGGADISGGLNQAISASKEATDKAIAYYEKTNAENKATLSPYLTGGLTAYDAYNDALGLARPNDSVGGYLGLKNYNTAYKDPAKAAEDLNSVYGKVRDLFHPENMYQPNGMGGKWKVTQDMADSNSTDVKIADLKAIGGYVDAKLGGLGDLGGRRAVDFQSIKGMLPTDYSKYTTDSNTALGPDPNNKANWSTASMSSVLDKFRNSPGYQFALNEGLSAVSRQNAAKGLTNSGAELKGLNNYAQGQADQTYQQYVGNLANASGIGFTATGQQIASNSATGSAVGNADLVHGSNVGNAYLAGIQGQLAQSAQQSANSNSMFSTMGSLASTAMQAFGK